jgi:cyclopropane fatty-acyl-phospholipid synthase-like methyltransferase
MIGLSLSVYLLKLQRDNMDFFISFCKSFSVSKTSRFLEIGTGHGAYFVSALKNTSLGSYLGIDISPTSVEITKEFTEFCMNDCKKKRTIIEKDFFDFEDDIKYDVIVLSEVLEHVQEPLAFLKKALSIASDNAKIYVSTAINSPYPDHIYLFKTIDEVRELFTHAGLLIVDEIKITQSGVTLEMAQKRNYDIVVAFILEAIYSQ